MKKRLLAFAVAVLFCISMLPTAAAADTPSMTGTLSNGKLTVSVSGLSSDVVQVNFLAVNTSDKNKTDYLMGTATVSKNAASVTFTVKGTDYKISATTVTSSLSELALTPIEVKAKAEAYIGVTYVSHVQKQGWQGYVADGALSGTTGKALRLEGLKIKLTGDVPTGASITYKAHVQHIGWQSAVSDGAAAGTTGKSRRLEAIEVRIVKKIA